MTVSRDFNSVELESPGIRFGSVPQEAICFGNFPFAKISKSVSSKIQLLEKMSTYIVITYHIMNRSETKDFKYKTEQIKVKRLCLNFLPHDSMTYQARTGLL